MTETYLNLIEASNREGEGFQIADALDGQAIRVLQADDHAANRTVVELILSPTGAKVTSAENGAQAVELFKAAPYDVVIMDVQMPVMDGLTAIRHIRAYEKMSGRARTPIHTLSSNVLASDCQASLSAGADSHLTKPIHNATLLAVVLAAARTRSPDADSQIMQGDDGAQISSDSSLRQLCHVFEKAPNIVALFHGPQHVFEFANQAYRARFGGRPLSALPLRQAVPEFNEQGLADLLDDVYATGKPFVGGGVRTAVPCGLGGALEERFYDILLQPVGQNGHVSGVFFQGQDVTDREQAVLKQKQLIRELEHRVKNTLASVMAIAAQSARMADTFEGFRETFEGRLKALSRTHEALMSSRGESEHLGEIVHRELRPYEGSRVRLSGGPIRLASRDAVMLGMVMHELVTNSAKYGALSVDYGQVEVCWFVEGAGAGTSVTLDWRESAGPPVAPPRRFGFGSQLIMRAARRHIEKGCGLTFNVEGVTCRLNMPVGNVTGREALRGREELHILDAPGFAPNDEGRD